MSEHELQRVEVLSRVLDGRMHAATAASVLAISARQVQWLLRRYREDGAGAIRHGLRGRPSNNRIGTGLRDYALCLVRETYVDFGPTLASEKLAERHGLQVSAETLRKWMIADAAVTENKRLSEVLAYAMALQQATAPNVPPAGQMFLKIQNSKGQIQRSLGARVTAFHLINDLGAEITIPLHNLPPTKVRDAGC